MDTTTPSINTQSLINHPAHLFVGPLAPTKKLLYQSLQELFCLSHGCAQCPRCTQIMAHQHHAIRWFSSEKTYTREQLEDIFSIIAFARESDEHFFFVIEKADFLPPACANSLLKSLEEPPAGYHFILLTERSEQVLPTIRSRCLITMLHNAESKPTHELCNFFSAIKPNSLKFLQYIEQAAPNEQESIELLDRIFTHWVNEYKQAVMSNNQLAMRKIQHILATINQAFKKPPMPGSSKIFWKNLFLQIYS